MKREFTVLIALFLTTGAARSEPSGINTGASNRIQVIVFDETGTNVVPKAEWTLREKSFLSTLPRIGAGGYAATTAGGKRPIVEAGDTLKLAGQGITNSWAIVSFTNNTVVLRRIVPKKETAEPSTAPLPRAPQPGHSEGAR
jgi:hypothetical protein